MWLESRDKGAGYFSGRRIAMTQLDFNQIWVGIVNNLKPGTIIPNWTNLKGYLGDEMKVVEVKEDKLVIQAPKARKLIPVTREEFALIWPVWQGYKDGQVGRRQICDMTFFSKYVISILHWMEEIK
jgi:hypothetical protein